ncbi:MULTISPECIES: hypothetical protein [Nitrospirillum]|uniref:Lipoprotein n=1 Tax=Nitrospirillum amazonense TaxID=28077 RepID=A0A560EWN2_9PROT|nr:MULTISPECIES: hypothetical protein [Nitrospirillum]MEA1677064.1 hypothetical protein [Nitrospirillum sp. BR 11163]MEC4594503.1 hypothetical protein [Nitrospirillum amazonense]TWB13782.1 hypothetical protein FBZ88_13534 [Nitrospirillum amazonense]
MRNRVILGAAIGCLSLSGCVINADDSGHHYDMPRTATTVCRREVDHVYDDYYKIAFDLPVLATEADGRQTVVQPFTLMPRRDITAAAGRHVMRCVVKDTALISVSEDR